jgi:hypothetical protein
VVGVTDFSSRNDVTAELKAWKEKHRRFTERENEAAWRANRQMIVL